VNPACQPVLKISETTGAGVSSPAGRAQGQLAETARRQSRDAKVWNILVRPFIGPGLRIPPDTVRIEVITGYPVTPHGSGHVQQSAG